MFRDLRRDQIETSPRLTPVPARRSVAAVMRRALFALAIGLAAVCVAAPARANYHQADDLMQPGLGFAPYAIAVDQRHDDGPLWALDTTNQKVWGETTDSSRVGQFGTGAYSSCQLAQPLDIAVGPSSGNVYFSDAHNGRVAVCTPTGAFVRSYATGVTPGDIGIIPGSADGQCLLLIAASDYDSKIETMDAGGHWTNWGQSGDGPGQFPHLPHGMAVDPNRRVVYVSVDNDAYDDEQAHIEKFTPWGTYLGEWSVTNAAGSATPAYVLSVDSHGDVFATVGRCVVKYGPRGRLLARFACDLPSIGSLATDRVGDLFVSDAATDTVQVFQPVYPITTITSGPKGGEHWSDPTPEFQFAASQSGATFECRIDTDAWVACSTPFTAGHLADGTHTISVQATDGDGLTGPVTRTSFMIDTKPPNLKISTDTVTLSAGRVARIGLTCPASEASGPCAGDLFLQNVDRQATKQGLEYLLGFATLAIPSGETKAVKVRLTTQDRAILATLGSSHAQATVDVHDAVGNRTNGIVRAFTLQAP
jgi:hypothetical protein